MTDWLSAVAVRAHATEDETKAVLDAFGIAANPTAGVAHRLLLERVSFSGTKRIHDVTTPFSFEWELGPGLYCVAGDRNLVGKTSVLEVIRWAIRGRSDLREDVHRWIESVTVDFRIDEATYRVDFAADEGIPSGTIARRDTGAVLAVFEGVAAFEEAADSFFLDRLGLPTIPGWQGEQGGDGQQIVQSWPALSELLRVTDSTNLLTNSSSFGGLNGKLLELYAGLPWASTYEAARVAVREHSRRMGIDQRRRDAVAEAQVATNEALTSELNGMRSRLADQPDDAGWINAVDRLREAAARTDVRLSASRRALAAARQDLEVAAAVEIDDSRTLREFEEAALAGRFFGTLDPKICPRCDATIGGQRRQREADEHQCALCGTAVASAAVTDMELSEMRRRHSASAQAKSHAEAAVAICETEDGLATRAAEDARRELELLPGPSEASQTRRALELDIARLEGRLAAATETALPTVADPTAARTHDILQAAEVEARARLRPDQSPFTTLNGRVLTLCRQFGIVNAESVNLNAAGQLNLRTGGVAQPLSQLTPGERQRVKIAVVLSLLHLGRETGIGRHPGLVLIDSPAAHEVREADLGAILEQVATLVADTPGTQVIITTRELETAQRVIHADHLRLPQPDGTLW